MQILQSLDSTQNGQLRKWDVKRLSPSLNATPSKLNTEPTFGFFRCPRSLQPPQGVSTGFGFCLHTPIIGLTAGVAMLSGSCYTLRSLIQINTTVPYILRDTAIVTLEILCKSLPMQRTTQIPSVLRQLFPQGAGECSDARSWGIYRFSSEEHQSHNHSSLSNPNDFMWHDLEKGELRLSVWSYRVACIAFMKSSNPTWGSWVTHKPPVLVITVIPYFVQVLVRDR